MAVKTLVLGPEELAELESLRSHAERHRVPRAVKEKLDAGLSMPSREALCRYARHLPGALTVAYTVEEMVRASGPDAGRVDWVRHLSAWPAPDRSAVAGLMAILGFTRTIDACQVEVIAGAVHVVEPMEGGP
jgi:hypothetical protein